MVCAGTRGRVVPTRLHNVPAGTTGRAAVSLRPFPFQPCKSVACAHHEALARLSFCCYYKQGSPKCVCNPNARFPMATSPAVSRGSMSHLASHDQCINAATCYSAYSRNPRGAIFPEKYVSLRLDTGFASCLRKLKQRRWQVYCASAAPGSQAQHYSLEEDSALSGLGHP